MGSRPEGKCGLYITLRVAAREGHTFYLAVFYLKEFLF